MDPAQPVGRVVDASAPGARAGAESPHAIQVYALGIFRVFVHGEALGDEAWHRKKARQLFKLLLSRLNRRSPKEEVIELTRRFRKIVGDGVSVVQEVFGP